MKKIFILIALIVAATAQSLAHTGYTDTVKCPVCNGNVEFGMTMSMTTFGSYLDFQKQGAIGYYYEEMINACPACYYSGYHSDFDTVYVQSYIDSIKVITAKYKGKKIDDALECEIAAEIKRLHSFAYDDIASIYLYASYFLRTDSLQTTRRKQMQQLTIDYLDQAMAKGEFEKDAVATINYLIGEMYRRIGDFDKAVEHFDLAIDDKHKKDWVKEVAEKQKELALKKDENNDI